MNKRLTAPDDKDADRRDQVGTQPAGARQAEEELAPVLDAHGVEEERKAQRSDHGRRDGLRGEPSHAQGHEQDRAHAQGESLEVDLSHQVADRDSEEQREQRLLLEQRPDWFHVGDEA